MWKYPGNDRPLHGWFDNEPKGFPMRNLVLVCAVLAITGCANQPPPFRGGPPPGMDGTGDGGRGMPPGGPGGPGRLFISPMGEPFRAQRGEGDPQEKWFAGVDTNGDGKLTLAEFTRDAARFFAVLDRGHDGEIDPDDIDYYETVLAPEIRVGGGGEPAGGRGGGERFGRGGRGGGGPGGGGPDGGMGGGGPGGGPGGPGGDGPGGGGAGAGRGRAAGAGRQGAARFGYFDLPEPVTAADSNFNRGISPDEFERAAAKRFAVLDVNGDGILTQAELPRVSSPGGGPRKGGGRPPRDRDEQR